MKTGMALRLVGAVALAFVSGCESERPEKRPPHPPTQIVFASVRDGDADIYVMNADGSGERALTQNDSFDAFPALSPGGRRIAFEAEQNGNVDLYVMNVDGSDEVRLTFEEAVDGVPAWSPDGAKIAFASAREGNFRHLRDESRRHGSREADRRGCQ
jgi:dipeptidyl aminopeptidase/acylaminoacyl peptidase